MKRLLSRLLLTAAIVIGTVPILLAAMIFGPPLFSGALILKVPSPIAPFQHDLPPYYGHLHKGHVDLATGLYVREDEDLTLNQTPPFVWRRTYLSGDRVSRQFGVGATHNAEWYLIGDAKRFKWLEMIRDDGARIHFDRLTPGSGYPNAVYGHASSETWFFGALVGWTGLGWTMRTRDGTILSFQDCGPGSNKVCSLVAVRDPDGHTITLSRGRAGVVRTISNGRQNIRFEYDGQQRITRASDDSSHSVDYSYDAAGRLTEAKSLDAARSYEYDNEDRLVRIHDPDRIIENVYDGAGRLVHQTVRRPGQADYVETFEYTVAGNAVIETTLTESDGTRTVYRFDDKHGTTLEIADGAEGSSMVSYDRTAGGLVRSITVRCVKNGKRVTETMPVQPGSEEEVKTAIIAGKCDRP